jgi:hypothetical protein
LGRKYRGVLLNFGTYLETSNNGKFLERRRKSPSIHVSTAPVLLETPTLSREEKLLEEKAAQDFGSSSSYSFPAPPSGS